MRDLKTEGCSLRAVAQRLNTDGLRQKRGGALATEAGGACPRAPGMRAVRASTNGREVLTEGLLLARCPQPLRLTRANAGGPTPQDPNDPDLWDWDEDEEPRSRRHPWRTVLVALIVLSLFFCFLIGVL